jgi:hypothetical protein
MRLIRFTQNLILERSATKKAVNPLTFHRRDSGSASAGAITRSHHHVSAGIPSIWSIWFWLRW